MNALELSEVGHGERAMLAAAQVRAACAETAPLGLRKHTSNLFRDRVKANKQRLGQHALDHVLGADAQGGWVDVEGMASYQQIVDWTLARASMPAVVPRLKTITAGGAAAGVGIEASSFRDGLVHDTLREIEVLLPGGEIVICSPSNQHSDLFFGFPNSYGTLGYALRLRLGALPAGPLVRVDHHKFQDSVAFFDAMAAQCRGDADFLDGVVFGKDEHALSVARFTQDAPWQSDYTFKHIYYRSVRERQVDFLSTRDYLWRWDTDWFWCSSNFGAERPWLRRLLGPRRLNSRNYQQWMRWNARLGLTRGIERWQGRHMESVIQDVDIPLPRAAQFLEFLHREIGILPIWVCPVRGAPAGRSITLYPLQAASMYVNFGFWSRIESAQAVGPGHFNRLVEQEVLRLGGIKSLYSESYFTRDEFAQAYNLAEYERLKARYDPLGRAAHLYDKCVGRL